MEEHNDEEEPPYHYERNNSLPELFGDEAHQQSWEKYWAKNGERLIWQSWIEKYIDYINPEYLDQNKMPTMSAETTADSQKLNIEEGQAFMFEPPPIAAEIVISSPAKQSSENLMIELSSDNKKPRRYLHSNSNGGNENLLSPRCDSINSSVPFTIDCTTDSMTNVTRMTISSYGFGSSHVTSESTPTESSESSKESSNSVSSFSASDDDDSDNQMATTRAAYECEKLLMANKSEEQLPSSNDKDSEECWQKRWQSHAQENYVKHYNTFMETHRILQEEMSSSFKSDSGFLPGEQNASGCGGGHKRRKKSGRKKGSHSLQRLVANLNLSKDLVKQSHAQKEEEEPIKDDEAPADANDNHEQSQQSDSTVIDTTEQSLMESMGLPTAFSSRQQELKKGGGGNDPPDERPISLKRCHEIEGDADNVEVDHIKSQFEMMGYAFVDKKSCCEAITKGEIVYRKKHVRLHNRMLKMFPSSSAKPRHTFFDDDGKEIVEENVEQEEGNLLHSSSDEDAPITQPPSSRINNAIVPFTSQLSSDGNANDEVGVAGEEQVNINLSIDQEYDHVEEGAIANNNDDERQSAKREKKKKRKGKFQASIPVEIANDKVLRKYWYKRFSLFSLFDQGIQLDRGKKMKKIFLKIELISFISFIRELVFCHTRKSGCIYC